MIKRVSKNKYEVLDSTGKKVLGTHSTHEQALRQLRAIEASKHARAKKS